MKEKTPLLAQLFLICFLVFWSCFTVFIVGHNQIPVILCALAGSAALVFIGKQVETIEHILTPFRFKLIFCFLAVLFFAVLFAFALDARISLPSDTDIVYDSIPDLLDDFRLNEVNPDLDWYYPEIGLETNADYFCMYPNNIALLLLLSAVYAITGGHWQAGTPEGQTPALFFTSLCIFATVMILCYMAHRITKKRTVALLTLILLMAFQAYYFSAVNFYTDIIVLPFAVGAAAMLLNFFYTEKYGWLIGSGVLFSVASCVKITAAILLVAAVIVLLLMPLSPRKKRFGATVPTVALCSVLRSLSGLDSLVRMV